jgi:hypothetical protein
LRNNEIILLQSLLTQEYFDNLVPVATNKYVGNNTYDEAEPLESQVYDNIVKVGDDDTIQETLCTQTKEPIASAIWKSCFPSSFLEIAYDGSDSCGFVMLSNIIEKRIQKTLSVNELRLELYREYSKYLDKYHDQIIDVLIMEGKRTLGNQVKSNTINFQSMIFTDGYYITNLDVWIMMQKYKIPSILISSKEIMQTNYTNTAFVLYNDTTTTTTTTNEMCFIVTTTNRFKVVVPKYKVIQDETGEIFVIPIPSCQERIQDALRKTIQLEDYLSRFSGVELNKLKKKKIKLVIEEEGEGEGEGEEVQKPIPIPIPKKKKQVLKIEEDKEPETMILKEKQQKTVVLKTKTRKQKPKLRIVENTPPPTNELVVP